MKPLALFVLAVSLSLADEKVKTQTGPGADLTRYRTYEWLAPRVLTKTGVVEDHPANPLVKDAVNRQLAQKGLTEVTEAGDLQVATTVLTESIPQVEAMIFGAPGPMMYGTPIATVGRYNKEGTLVVNLIDTRTKKSAWVGMAKESLPSDKTLAAEVIRGKLRSAADKMFKQFPKK